MSKSADKSLKSINQPKLIIFVVLNVIFGAGAIIGYEKTLIMVREIGGGNLQMFVRLVCLPATAGLTLGVLSWFVPKPWKETLVFWRVGVHRLPSSEAFTRIASADLRIDKTKLEARLGKLPADPKEQSALWYRIYRKYSDDISVIDAHAAYLLYREMTALIPILLVTIIVWSQLIQASAGRIAVVSIFVVAAGLITSFAARNAGTRLVSNVLAIEAANSGNVKEPPPQSKVLQTRPHLSRHPKGDSSKGLVRIPCSNDGPSREMRLPETGVVLPAETKLVVKDVSEGK